MAVSLAAGMPTYSGSAIPELYPVETLIRLYAKTLITKIASTDHEDELKKMGDVAHIRMEPSVTMRQYSVGMEMVPNTQTLTTVDLTIDKAYYADEEIPLVVAKQSDLDLLNMFQNAIVNSAAVKVDNIALSTIATGADASNSGATAGVKSASYNLGATGAAVVITELNAMDKLVDLIAVMKERDAVDNLWLYVPYWYAAKLKKSDLKAADEMGDTKSVIRTGLLGMIDGVEIWESNNLTSVTDGTDSTTCWYAQCGHKTALAFAQTIQETRVVEPSGRFSKRAQALVVFGTKVVNDDYLSSLYCRPGA
jgi:hypothetical protein